MTPSIALQSLELFGRDAQPLEPLDESLVAVQSHPEVDVRGVGSGCPRRCSSGRGWRRLHRPASGLVEVCPQALKLRMVVTRSCTASSSSSDWVACSLTCTPPTGLNFFFGVDFATSTGDVYIDNLRLTH
jgi:hypothetical protein